MHFYITSCYIFKYLFILYLIFQNQLKQELRFWGDHQRRCGAQRIEQSIGQGAIYASTGG